jgi:hypothetical protein
MNNLKHIKKIMNKKKKHNIINFINIIIKQYKFNIINHKYIHINKKYNKNMIYK